MDMLPPQAPPAHVAHANQAVLDTLDRLSQTQLWFAKQQDALPEPPADGDDPDAFLATLDAFWEVHIGHIPGKMDIPRRQALALYLAQTVRDDASLRRNDGTLDDNLAMLAHTVAVHPGGPLPSHLKAYELLVGSVPYAGALVLQDERHPGKVLLFTAHAGWQVFDSLDSLYREVEQTMREELVHRAELPGVGVDDMATVIGTHFLGTRPLDGEIFDTLARRLIARLRERVTLAWTFATTARQRGDALHDALHLHSLLDIHAIVRSRDLALAGKREEERLARQPATVRDHWLATATAYRDHWRDTANTPLTPLPSLASFADTALAADLRRHGIHVPPRELRVRLTHRLLNKPIATAISGFQYEDLSLLELAYRNVSNLFTEGLQVIHADGSPRSEVSAQVIGDIIRDLDLPHRYAQHLDTAMGSSPEGQQQRLASTAMQRARMRFEAADARLAYYNPQEPRSFAPDQHERGFHWVQAILDHPHPAQRARVEKHEIVVHQLTYKGAVLADVFLIGVRQPKAVSTVVLYTPNAPDGIAFREFGHRDDLRNEFLLDRRFEAYLLDRLPAEFAEVDAYGKRHFKLVRLNDNRTLSWIFNLSTCTNCTELSEDFQEREVTGSFLDAAYDAPIELAKRNVNDAASSTTAADVRAVANLLWYWNFPVQLTLELVTGVAQSIPHTAQASWRFYDHVKNGESTEAFLAFVNGYTSALMALPALPLYTRVPRLTGAYMRTAPGSRAFAPTHRSLPAPETIFEKRFLAKDIKATGPETSANSGVFSLGSEGAGTHGRGVIRQGDKLYHVRFDNSIGGWRLSKPGGGYEVPIEQLPNGSWQYRKVGLLGGSGRGAGLTPTAMLEEVKQILTDPMRLSPEVAALTEAQRVALIAKLYESLPYSDLALVLRRQVDSGPRPIALSRRQSRAWDEALQLARNTPPNAALPSLSSTRPVTQPQAGPSGAGSTITSSLATSPLDRVRRLPPREWPTHAYAYLSPRSFQLAVGNGRVTLHSRRILQESIDGIPVTTLPPTTPLSNLTESLRPWLPRPPLQPGPNATLGSISGGWIRIDLRQLPMKDIRYPTQQTFTLHRLHRSDGYVLRPMGWMTTRAPESVDLLEGTYELGINSAQLGVRRQASPMP